MKNLESRDGMDKPTWDEYFMNLAWVAAMRSPDVTKHGAVAVDSEHRILGLGYNGFPRNSDEGWYPLMRPQKYKYIIHAEENCLLNCSHMPDSGVVLYVTGVPCSGCMKTIIQKGIKYVIHDPFISKCVDEEDLAATKLMAKNHGVHMHPYNIVKSRLLHDTIKYRNERNASEI